MNVAFIREKNRQSSFSPKFTGVVIVLTENVTHTLAIKYITNKKESSHNCILQIELLIFSEKFCASINAVIISFISTFQIKTCCTHPYIEIFVYTSHRYLSVHVT